ncbi:MAG: DUF3857 and transglutaminase domain-containing protein [Marinilabiliales bacterium]|nr:DUF3857 and transglutaminase domain-containing protein [Marinilabiliales bacterium]
MKKCLLLLVTLVLFSVAHAQDAPKIKFEKVSKEELTANTYPQDTTAEAAILYDEGNSYVRYDNEAGFLLYFDRFVRIKILKQGGTKWGEVHIPLYSSAKSKEKLYKVEGTTFNMENGKIVKTELKKDAIFHDRENKYWESVRLAMPAVKAGSVIDIRYTINSDLLWNLQPWRFQYAIPVSWSSYRVTYPEFFIYNMSSMGYHPLLKSSKNQITETIVSYDRDRDDRTGASSLSANKISYTAYVHDFVSKDIPAITEEPYVSTIDNYTSRLKFELSGVDFMKVGGSYKNYTTSWNDIATSLKDDDDFGMQLRGNGFAEDLAQSITKNAKDPAAKIDALYSWAQKNLKWNGDNSISADKSMKKLSEEKSGNSAAINLFLTLLLRKSGIEASPVILSTRAHGLLKFQQPTISDCNYVIVKATVDGKEILLDATEPKLQAGLLPYRCLNGEGHLIKDNTSETVKLVNPRSTETTAVELSLKAGKLSGTIQTRKSGLAAADQRKSISKAGSVDEYFKQLKNEAGDFEYKSFTSDKLDSLSLPYTSNAEVVWKEQPDADSGILYIEPVLVDRIKTNPFTAPTRQYPVDYGNSFVDNYMFQLTIPEGYTAEELPTNTSLQLEGKGGSYIFQVIKMDSKIVINQRITIDKTLFLPAEYEGLKKFYNTIINKQAEKIVLKKSKA